mgnify:CR=1 FL=1
MKNYIGISRDHSASMGHLKTVALNDYTTLVQSIKTEAERTNIDTWVSVVRCGAWPRDVAVETVNSPIKHLPVPYLYETTGTGTPLFDSVAKLIDIMEGNADASSPDVSFLIMIITDGEENCSKTKASNLVNRIAQLQKTDRWTFVFRVPKGSKHTLISMGIPDGNIQEWEQTQAGMQKSTIATESAFREYYSGRERGIRASASFYSTDLTNVTPTDLKQNLIDVTSQVALWPVPMNDSGIAIKDFCERHLTTDFQKGAAFYELTKSESVVQDYKKICVVDKTTNTVYSGTTSIRSLLGLPVTGNIKLKPGMHGNYKIYVQSTSLNRKLVGGTCVLYWGNAA